MSNWIEKSKELGVYAKPFLEVLECTKLTKLTFLSDQLARIPVDKETGLLNTEKCVAFCNITCLNSVLIDKKIDVILSQLYDTYKAKLYLDEHPELKENVTDESTDTTADEAGEKEV